MASWKNSDSVAVAPGVTYASTSVPMVDKPASRRLGFDPPSGTKFATVQRSPFPATRDLDLTGRFLSQFLALVRRMSEVGSRESRRLCRGKMRRKGVSEMKSKEEVAHHEVGHAVSYWHLTGHWPTSVTIVPERTISV